MKRLLRIFFWFTISLLLWCTLWKQQIFKLPFLSLLLLICHSSYFFANTFTKMLLKTTQFGSFWKPSIGKLCWVILLTQHAVFIYFFFFYSELLCCWVKILKWTVNCKWKLKHTKKFICCVEAILCDRMDMYCSECNVCISHC